MESAKKTFMAIYLLGFGVFGLVFEIRYLVENGYIQFVMIGWVVPAIQALAWPFYVMSYLI